MFIDSKRGFANNNNFNNFGGNNFASGPNSFLPYPGQNRENMMNGPMPGQVHGGYNNANFQHNVPHNRFHHNYNPSAGYSNNLRSNLDMRDQNQRDDGHLHIGNKSNSALAFSHNNTYTRRYSHDRDDNTSSQYTDSHSYGSGVSSMNSLDRSDRGGVTINQSKVIDTSVDIDQSVLEEARLARELLEKKRASSAQSIVTEQSQVSGPIQAVNTVSHGLQLSDYEHNPDISSNVRYADLNRINPDLDVRGNGYEATNERIMDNSVGVRRPRSEVRPDQSYPDSRDDMRSNYYEGMRDIHNDSRLDRRPETRDRDTFDARRRESRYVPDIRQDYRQNTRQDSRYVQHETRVQESTNTAFRVERGSPIGSDGNDRPSMITPFYDRRFREHYQEGMN